MPAPTRSAGWSTESRLSAELSSNLSNVKPITKLDYDPPVSDAKAIIAPHAGYSYSGPTAAWAYAAIPTDKVKRVFLLGPSHHAYLAGVALSTFDAYETPVGDISLCKKTISDLRDTGIFSDMKHSVDEDEHSLEMHLPYIRHVFKDRDDLRLVPILVGHPSRDTSDKLSEVLAKYWQDEETFFIISSDFCHWGTRFSCTPYYPNAPPPPNPVPPVPDEPHSAAYEPPTLIKRFSSKDANPDVPIWKSIQFMDHEGMDLLKKPAEFGASEKWEAYLDRTKNTICGRNPITVLVNLIQYIYGDKTSTVDKDQRHHYHRSEEFNSAAHPEFTFVRYEQSSKCKSGSDSSVSYVSGILRVPGHRQS
ncbi:hypothetical protein I317_02622 [Kwoniella heveanensis CBS 569]|nr:hypothetical protein I317_02622 [Kwoniella heveanensis CBS 569]